MSKMGVAVFNRDYFRQLKTTAPVSFKDSQQPLRNRTANLRATSRALF